MTSKQIHGLPSEVKQMVDRWDLSSPAFASCGSRKMCELIQGAISEFLSGQPDDHYVDIEFSVGGQYINEARDKRKYLSFSVLVRPLELPEPIRERDLKNANMVEVDLKGTL